MRLRLSMHSEHFNFGKYSVLTSDTHLSLFLTDSKAHKELNRVVASTSLLKDIGKLSSLEQTSGLEAYHKVVIYFAPKSAHFSYNTMKGRLVVTVCLKMIT